MTVRCYPCPRTTVTLVSGPYKGQPEVFPSNLKLETLNLKPYVKCSRIMTRIDWARLAIAGALLTLALLAGWSFSAEGVVYALFSGDLE